MLTPNEIARLGDRCDDMTFEFDVALRSIAAEALADPEHADPRAVRDRLYTTSAVEGVRLDASTAHIMRTSAKQSIARDEKVYAQAAAAGAIPQPAPVTDTPAIENTLTTGLHKATSGTGYVRTAAVEAVNTEFTSALDEARRAILSGSTDTASAVRSAVKRIATMTPVVHYRGADGRIVAQSVYGAVRRFVVTSTSQTVLAMQEMRLLEVGGEYVQVSAHMGARPEHAEWQGGVYRFDELPEICGYGDGAGLGGYNCRHSFTPFFPDINTPTDWLAGDERDNEDMYAAEQRQRLSERNIRRYKARERVYRAGGQDDLANQARDRKRGWQGEADAAAAKQSGRRRPEREVANR